MFNFKKTYTINFEKTKTYYGVGQYTEFKNAAIVSRLCSFCIQENIKIKKILMEPSYSTDDKYIKIYGTQLDYEKLIAFCTLDTIMNEAIKIKKLKW